MVRQSMDEGGGMGLGGVGGALVPVIAPTTREKKVCASAWALCVLSRATPFAVTFRFLVIATTMSHRSNVPFQPA